MLGFNSRLFAILFSSWASVALSVRKRLEGSIRQISEPNESAKVTSHPQDEALSAVLMSQVESLCVDDVVREGCSLLGVHPDANASITHLAEILAAEEAEALELVKALGIEVNRTFGCRAFCGAAVTHIPSILSMSVPFKPRAGCIDVECKGDTIDLSEGALIREGLQAPPPDATDYNLTLASDPTPESVPNLDPKIRRQIIFRTALNVIFGIFPAPGSELKKRPSAAPLRKARKRAKRHVGNGVDVEFGPKTDQFRHRHYEEYSLKAAAWIAGALRKLKAGRNYVKKWFILDSEEAVDAQILETRRHLTRMLQLMSWFVIKKGSAKSCKVTDKGNGVKSGTAAYVMVTSNCGVSSKKDCGEKMKNGRYILNVCDWYWQDTFHTDVRVGTLVHESSHHFGTDDEGYCSQIDCLALSSSKARNNADTYTKLVQELVLDRRVIEESLAIPHLACNTICGGSTFGEFDFNKSLSDDECGRCVERVRVFGSCSPLQKVATKTMSKLCCSKHKCYTTTTTTTMQLFCPSNTASRFPDHDGDCFCREGYGCSQSGAGLDCPSRQDQYGRQWFSANCGSCKCHLLHRPRWPVAWPQAPRPGNWSWLTAPTPII